MDDSFIIETLIKYSRQEKLDGNEYALLEKWHARWGEGRPLADLIHDQEWLRICLYRQHVLPGQKDWRELKRRIAAAGDPLPASRLGTRLTAGIVSAAALILLAVATSIVHTSGLARRATSSNAFIRVTSLDYPSSGLAELICQNGRSILIDRVANNGIIVEEGNVLVRKLDKHTLQYELQPNKPATPMVHFFSSGKTGAYKLLFPDGSRVYLKNGASLRYSTALRDTGQPMLLGGEAWFSIAKSSETPLSVMVSGTIIDVLGTEFHVGAAAGDSVTKVCVYRGAVRVRQGLTYVTLRDSDEVAVQNNMLLSKKKISDFDALLAGTDIDQRFHFDNCSLTEVVQQIADHYHIDVINPTHTQGIPIKGDPAQDLPLRVLLKDIELIENGNTHLTLNGKTILVGPVPQR